MKKVINILIAVFVVFFSKQVLGQLPLNDNTSGGVETVTIPAGVTCIRVQVWGAGGAGGGNNTGSNGGGGGGGGGYSESYLTVVPLTVYSYSVGAGGLGVLSNNGGAGSQTWFINAATVMANGGGGGFSETNGRNGGFGAAVGTGNIITLSGGDGGRGRNNNNGPGGGGGSSAGTTLNGNGLTFNAYTTSTAPAAPVGGGIGGDGFLGGGNGANGTSPGGGGGGSGERVSNIVFVKGGDGGSGVIIITASAPLCPTATTIAPAGIQNICIGSATSVLTASTTTAGAGCTATVQYQWYSSLLNSNTIATATLLPGQTLSTLTPQNLAASTLYYFCVSYAPSCAQTAATQALASNVVQVNIIAAPSVSAAGPDQSICIGSGATLAANTPVTGTGTWSIVAGSPSTNIAQITGGTSNPSATFTPTLGGTYTLRWTITNAPCTASTDDVVFTVGPTTSAAGPDQNICTTLAATLAANNPAIGVGAWSVTSGPSTSSAQFNNTAIINAIFTPAGGAGTYVLTWTITSAGPCVSTDAVSITFVAPPSVSAAGPDQSICIGSGATLAANLPGTGTGTWTVVSGPSTASAQFSSTANQAAIFTPAGGIGTYVLRWSITNAPCTASTDDISVTVTCGGGCPACVTTYLHPAGIGIAGEKVGACEVADCGPSTYTDDGGPAGNYSNDIGSGLGSDAVYRVFCPSIAGNCMQVTFNSFNTYNNFDVLFVRNGPTEYSPNFTGPPTSPGAYGGNPSWTNGLWGNLGASVPFSFTSTHASGCLTFAFVTSAVNASSGWSATLSCTPCAGGPSGLTNSDCNKVTALCSNATINSNSTGPGIVAEACNGIVCPAGGENHTNWYWFQAATTGTLDVQVTPTTATDDYDIAIFGPNVTCGALGSPIRCSDSGGTGTTGAIGTPGDLTESVLGDKFVNQLNVIAGQSYYLMVDEWTPTGLGFTLSFGGTASLDCVVLPIELADFTTVYNKEEKGADIYWKTDSQRDNDYFTIEKSTDGNNFYELASVDGAGTTNMPTEYFAFDPEIGLGVTYYRLKQTDFNGEFKYSVLRSINVLPEVNDVLTLFPNPTNGKTEVIFNTYQNEISYMTVTDSKGFVLLNKEIECKAGGNITEIDLTDNAHGIYFVTITTANKVYSSKLIKE